jgi:hypothetical protein
MKGASIDELAVRLSVRRSLLEDVLGEEVELGRVRRDPRDGRYRIVPERFEREVLHALWNLGPEDDVDESRPARRVDGRTRAHVRRNGLRRHEEAVLELPLWNGPAPERALAGSSAK